jgi:hypothetical protein
LNQPQTNTGPAIRPNIGRIVWYWPDGERGKRAGKQPLAAQISFVHSDDCVNLGFLHENGNHGYATSVRLWDGQGERPVGPYCEWMPYQVQAARRQGVEGQIEHAGEQQLSPAKDGPQVIHGEQLQPSRAG